MLLEIERRLYPDGRLPKMRQISSKNTSIWLPEEVPERTCGLLVTDKLPATVPSSEGRRFLRRGKHPLFGSYAPENLELFLKEQFGPNKRMCNLRFRTYRSRFADDSTGPQKIRVWKAARYSSAAPTYFPSLDKYIDGDDVAPNSGE
ncbi:hypothetical protein niasHT_026246 [Heterodera trifolii]|uniref:Uncharacterized protein n=1 Tax=Heterodera trifolii TaxID=157864 RepID=A0ABD2JC37_9BILA